MLKGSCLCGAVRYEVSGMPPLPSVCHCSQCRKQSGHVWASSFVPDNQISIAGPVTWFAASETARRGFCGTCGAFLFWKHNEEDTTSFSMGSVEAPSGLRLGRHIFTADKGDYYEIEDGLPQKP